MTYLADQPDPAGPYAGPVSTEAGRTGGVVAVVVPAVLLAASGILLAWLWQAVAPTTPLRRVDGGAYYVNSEPEQPFGADGTLLLLGIGLGVAAAIATWALARRGRGPVQLGGLILGGLVAGTVAGWWATHRDGVDAFHTQLLSAPVGTVLERPPVLHAGGLILGVVPTGVLLAPALAVAVVYALLAAWSNHTSLRADTPDDDEYDGSAWD